MEVVDAPSPTPPDGGVVIRTEAVGVGGVDAVIRRGTLGLLASAEGLIPGSEVAGTVIAVGEGVDRAWLGRRVWAFTGTSGGYAEEAVAQVEDVLPLPAGLSPMEAVTLGSAAPVAHFALAHAHLTAGERVLIRGAGGSIGLAAVELAVRAGAAAVAVTTSSRERGERLRALGATHVLDRGGESAGDGDNGGDDAEAGPWDVIVDIVGGADLPGFLDRLAPNGRLVLVGAVAGFPPPTFGQSLLDAFRLSRSFAAFSLDSVPRDLLRRTRAELFEAAVRGELHPVVESVLPLVNAAEAHRAMDEGRVFGRIVLTP